MLSFLKMFRLLVKYLENVEKFLSLETGTRRCVFRHSIV